MKIRALHLAIGVLSAVGASHGHSFGGGGPVVLNRWHGGVQIKPLESGSYFRKAYGNPNIALKRGWQPVMRGEYVGSFLLRTAKGAWAHLNEKGACLDGSSLLMVQSFADVELVLRRGRISAVDGKRGPALARVGQQLYW